MRNLFAKPYFFALAFLIACAGSMDAQTGTSTIAAVTPGNTSQCTYYSYIPYPGQTVQSSNLDTPIVSGGTCVVPVTWTTTLPTSLYAISCTPEIGVPAGFLVNTSIDGTSRTTTGFNLYVTYHINNVAAANQGNIPSGAYDVGGGNGTSVPDNYVVGFPPPFTTYYAPFTPSSLGTQYVDCIASNQ